MKSSKKAKTGKPKANLFVMTTTVLMAVASQFEMPPLTGVAVPRPDTRHTQQPEDNKMTALHAEENTDSQMYFLSETEEILETRDDSVYEGLEINEVCTSNTADCEENFEQADGSRPDWIELHNASNHEIYLGGIGLSNGKKNHYKFTFPENTVLPANGYVLVLCEKQEKKDSNTENSENSAGNNLDIDENKIYTAPFNLSRSGEDIYLSAPKLINGTDGSIIDQVSVPLLQSDTSYGLYTTTENTKAFRLLHVSPCMSNDEAQPIPEQPVFSAEGGFYDDTFSLTLRSPWGYEIYYTLDGSDPADSVTAECYTEPILIYDNTEDENVLAAYENITTERYFPDKSYYEEPDYPVEKGIIVRAVCQDAEGQFSTTATNGYYIGKDTVGESEVSYQDITVVSFATDIDNLFHGRKGIYVLGRDCQDLLSSMSKSEVEATYHYADSTLFPANYNKGVARETDREEVERPCNVQVYENGKLQYTSDVGVRISGNFSRGYAQKSLKLYARSDYGAKKMEYAWLGDITDADGKQIDAFEKINLHNGGSDYEALHFRDEFIMDLCRDKTNLSMIHFKPCVVFINGEFWGFYFIREKMDADWVEENYGIPAEEVSFISKNHYDGQQEELGKALQNCIDWACEADMSSDENYQKVCDMLDIDSYIDFLTVETYIANSDWSYEDGFYNWKMWRADNIDPDNPYADGKWRFALYDVDQSAGIWGAGESSRSSYKWDSLGDMNRTYERYNFCRMFYHLLDNREFRERFHKRYLEIMETVFDTDIVLEKLDAYDAAYAGLLAESQRRFGDAAGGYDYSIENTREFFEERPYYAKKYLDDVVYG